MKRKVFGILFALVLALTLSLVTAVPVSAGAITSIDVTPVDSTAGATTDYSIGFTPATGEATNVVIDFSAFGTTATDMVLTGVSTTIGDYSFTGFSVNPTGVTVNDTAKTITFTGGTTAAATAHTIDNAVAGTGLRIANDQDAETQNVVISTTSDSGTFALTIDPGAATKFVILDPTDGTVDAAITVTVEAQDQYGNKDTTYAQDVTLVTDGSATGAGLVDIVAGTGSLDISDQVAETVNLSLDDTQTTGLDCTSTQDVVFAPGALASFTITGTPASILAGAAFPSPANDIIVTAYDAWSNVKTDYDGTVTWSSSAAVATLPADYTFVGGDAGVHTFLGSEFILSTVGTQTITVTDAAVSETSSEIAVWFGGGGGGGAPPADTTSPSISDISTSNITETSADISWRTNELSTSQVEYWSSPSILSPLNETMVIAHLVRLTGLTPGTTYHYKTMSEDSAGNLAVSDEDTFTTSGEAPAAVFSASDLSISPSEVNIGETVTISVLVANSGNAAGDYEVTLKINDVAEATKDVTVAAGASEEVTFTTAKDVAGSYSVDFNGLSGSFTVKEEVAPPTAPPATAPPEAAPPEVEPPINWPLVGGIIAAVIVAALISFMVSRRRA